MNLLTTPSAQALSSGVTLLIMIIIVVRQLQPLLLLVVQRWLDWNWPEGYSSRRASSRGFRRAREDR